MTTPIYDREFLASYIETALWSSNDDDDVPLDQNYSEDDIDEETLDKLNKEAARFYAENERDIETGYAPKFGNQFSNEEMAGHDFWLTRNGHGAGFWDGDWMEPQATRLTEASKRYGEVYLYVGDDGKIYADGGQLEGGSPMGEFVSEDDHRVTALDLHTENERWFYDAWKKITAAAAVHALRRNYDPKRLQQAYMRIVDEAAKRFAPEYAEQDDRRPRPWHIEFPIEVRRLVAAGYVRDFEQKFQSGELEWLVPERLRSKYIHDVRVL